MKLIKLNEVYSDWITGDGIFTDLNEFDVPWKEENIVDTLNMTYHGSHSGDKNVSPFIVKFLEADDANMRSKLASAIFHMYADKWSKTWNALQIDYNPLENYNMTETETPAEITHTITPAETTETITPAETTETITPAETTDTVTPAETTVTAKPAKTVTENDVSAFNSSDYANSDRVTVTGDVNDKGTNTLTVDEAGTNVTTVNTSGSNVTTVNTAGSNKTEVDTAGSDVLTVQNDRELTRSGNIGVTTSQMMLESELRLRKWLFYNEVFNDIDNILTLSIY